MITQRIIRPWRKRLRSRLIACLIFAEIVMAVILFWMGVRQWL